MELGPEPWHRQPSTHDLLLMIRHAGEQGVLGVIESCLGMWSDTVAGAEVESRLRRLSGRTNVPHARVAVARGGCPSPVDVADGRPMLTPAIISHVHGDSTVPSSWRYVLQVASPDRVTVGTYPAARVLHWRRSPSTSMPWRGRSVMDDCPALAALSAARRAGAWSASIASRPRDWPTFGSPGAQSANSRSEDGT